MNTSLFLDPFDLASNVLDRSVLDAQLNGGRAEETAPKGLGQDLGQSRFKLDYLLGVTVCLGLTHNIHMYITPRSDFQVFFLATLRSAGDSVG